MVFFLGLERFVSRTTVIFRIMTYLQEWATTLAHKHRDRLFFWCEITQCQPILVPHPPPPFSDFTPYLAQACVV